MCAFDAAGLEEEESGWKYIHGDVFRFPPMKNLFCAFIGTGTQVRGQNQGRIIYIRSDLGGERLDQGGGEGSVRMRGENWDRAGQGEAGLMRAQGGTVAEGGRTAVRCNSAVMQPGRKMSHKCTTSHCL